MYSILFQYRKKIRYIQRNIQYIKKQYNRFNKNNLIFVTPRRFRSYSASFKIILHVQAIQFKKYTF